MNPKHITEKKIKQKTAIIILAYADYESLELALATHARFTVDSGVPIYILQNGRGTYDTERTYSVGRRYESLYPNTVRVITHIPPQKPYLSIKQLLHDDIFSQYEYIIKLDDDVMVLTPNWVDQLIDCYLKSYEKDSDNLAYVTSLVNNNPFGFKTLIESCEELSREYFEKLARPHLIGCAPDDNYNPYQIVSKDTVFGGGFGTIWRLPYVARWLHEKTTMNPSYYIDSVKKLGTVEVNAKERYSINCMLFEKSLWDDIGDGGTDDEHMLHVYCLLKRKRIFANLAVPMIHIAFYSQREEVRDMLPQIRNVFTDFLALPFPISLCNDRLREIENRLRFMESNQVRFVENSRMHFEPAERHKTLPQLLRGGVQCYREHGFKYTFNRGLVHLHLKKK